MIRLEAQNFYVVIADKAKGQIKYYIIEILSK